MIANNRISDCALSAIRDNAGSNCQIVANNASRSGEVAIFVEFGFSGAVVADNVIDRASDGISVTNYNEGGRLAAVTGNIVRNLYRDGRRAPGEPTALGRGIAVEADTVVAHNVVENAPSAGLWLGYGRYLRGVIASANIVRGGEYGIAVSVVEGAGSAIIRGNLLSGNTVAAIAGFDHDEAVTADLAVTGAGDHPHLSVSGERRALADPFQDRAVVGDGRPAHVEDTPEPRRIELHVAGLSAELHRRQHVHGDPGRADRVALGFQPARGIDRQLAVLGGETVLDDVGAAPFPGQGPWPRTRSVRRW